jgi:hypothetical protein
VSRKIAILGSASTTIDQAPWKDETWEIWTIGRHEAPRTNLIFELHPWDTRTEEVKAQIKSVGVPVLVQDMSQLDDPIPLHAETFPLVDVLLTTEGQAATPPGVEPIGAVEWNQGYTQGDEGTIPSSIGYMLAYALAQWAEAGRPKDWQVGLWGVDMLADGEYADQRSQCEYMIGLMRGAGLPVFVPEGCALLKTDGAYAYNPSRSQDYDGAPVDLLLYRVRDGEKKLQSAVALVWKIDGQVAALQEFLDDSDLDDDDSAFDLAATRIEEFKRDYDKAKANANMLEGTLQAHRFWLTLTQAKLRGTPWPPPKAEST